MGDILVFDDEEEATRLLTELPADVFVFDNPALALQQAAGSTDFLLFDSPAPEIVAEAGEQQFLLVDEPPPAPEVRSVETGADILLITTSGVRGPQGPPGANGDPFQYQMPTAQTTALVDHTLGYDPVAVQVFDEDGLLCSEYSVVFTIPDQQVRVGFDIALKATIRLI